LYVTRVHATVQGDTYFPDITTDQWLLKQTDSFAADEKNDHDYSFLVYQRNDSPG
jgi:dihydrofolate reductase